MAEKRMVSKSISISERVNLLPDIFDMLLFTWLIPHTDDFGRLTGSPAKVKALVVPMLDKSIRDVEDSLGRLRDAGLVSWYEVNNDKYIQINNFDKHQEGLKRRAASKLPAPTSCHLTSNNGQLSASESDIEELMILQLEQNLVIDGDKILKTERQLRINNSYLDILATGQSTRRYLFELKRQRLSNAAIDQIIKYREMLGEPMVCAILVGNGLASNFDLKRCQQEQINILTYDETLVVEPILLIDVKCRQLTLHTEQKGREEKGKGREEEGKGTEGAPSPESNPHKDRIHQLINDCQIQEYTLYHLDIIFSYIGAVDIEVIETAIKKGTKKHINYTVNTLKGLVSEGKTKKEDVLPQPKVGDKDEKSQGELRHEQSAAEDKPITGGKTGALPSKWASNIVQMPKVSG